MVLNWRSLNSWNTVTWKYINKYTQFPCYRFLPQSNWSFFLLLQKSTKKERDTFSSSCEINVVVLYMFLLLFPVLFGRHIYWSHTALKIDRFLDPRLVVFASLLHYSIIVSEMYYKMYFFMYYYYYFEMENLVSHSSQGWPKGLFPFISVANISRISGVVAKD